MIFRMERHRLMLRVDGNPIEWDSCINQWLQERRKEEEENDRWLSSGIITKRSKTRENDEAVYATDNDDDYATNTHSLSKDKNCCKHQFFFIFRYI